MRCVAFNPFTDTPVEGVNYVRVTQDVANRLADPSLTTKPVIIAPSQIWGAPTGTASYQLPRTYQFSLGVRF
jgi:hypothetical protein